MANWKRPLMGASEHAHLPVWAIASEACAIKRIDVEHVCEERAPPRSAIGARMAIIASSETLIPCKLLSGSNTSPTVDNDGQPGLHGRLSHT